MSTLIVDTITTDFITLNSGTCTGNFSADQFNGNAISMSGNLGGGSLTVNSASIAGAATAGSLNTNSAAVGGALTADSVSTNSAAVAGAVTAGSISANSGSITGALTTNSINANSGVFAVSLKVGSADVLTTNYAPPTRYYISTSPITITNMPSQLNLLGDTAVYVQYADLSNMNEVRFLVNQTVAGASTARMRANYSTGFGTTAADYSGVLSMAGPNGGLELNISTANAVQNSGWLPLNPAAKAPVYLGVVVSGGNGSADPKFGPVVVEFR